MKHLLQKIKLAALILVASALPLISVSVHAADAYGLEKTKSLTQFKGVTKTVPQLVGSIVSVALSLIGVVFLVLALYAGFKWMTSRGVEKDVTDAKNTLVNATIGIILIVAAYAITNFIFTDIVSQIN